MARPESGALSDIPEERNTPSASSAGGSRMNSASILEADIQNYVNCFSLDSQALPNSCYMMSEGRDSPKMMMFKPKILPLKNMTFEKMEKIQREIEKAVREEALGKKV